MAVKLTFSFFFATLFVASYAGLLETLLSWELPDSEARSSASQSKCLCQLSGCLCCVDLNLTSSIDLGGPACVNIRKKEENVSLNLSYGDNPVHNATIKIANAANKPTCMNLLSDLAQICAKFTSMKETDRGYDGCLVVQPALLSTPQATYNMGCFNFDQTVRQIEAAIVAESPEASEPIEEEEEEEDGINTDELIAAVSASAEQGIALFTQWLGLNLNPKLNFTAKDNSQKQQQQQQRSDTGATSRSARTIADVQKEMHDKNEERFKQLLSAQDNVLKGSATIGRGIGAQTTFVYSKPVGLASEKLNNNENEERNVDVDAKKVDFSQQRLTVVPKESRRGGRAYSIHQHVNEV